MGGIVNGEMDDGKKKQKKGKRANIKRPGRSKMYGQTSCKNGGSKGIQTATYRAKWTHSAN